MMKQEDIFAGKTLLITGGTGSFGNAVLKRFLNTEIKEIRIFSRDEKKQDDMRRFYNNSKIKYYIGDVRQLRSVQEAMRGVDYVFHAAALKQVPSCEFFPMEAVKTNIMGTDNVLTAAIAEGVKKVVCLSTDKAAYPINAMGISKAMMEKEEEADHLPHRPLRHHLRLCGGDPHLHGGDAPHQQALREGAGHGLPRPGGPGLRRGPEEGKELQAGGGEPGVQRPVPHRHHL